MEQLRSRESSKSSMETQPMSPLDKSKRSNSRKSLFDERLALVTERRKASETKIEQDVMESLKKNEAVYAKFEQRQAEKKQHLKDTRLKKDSRQKEVEMRRRQILEDNKKKTVAQLAKTDLQAQVTLRNKRSSPIDHKKRWSWSTSGGFGASGSMVMAPLPLSPSTQDLSDGSIVRRSSVGRYGKRYMLARVSVCVLIDF